MSSFVDAFFISPLASSRSLMSFLAWATMAMGSAFTAASSSGSPGGMLAAMAAMV